VIDYRKFRCRCLTYPQSRRLYVPATSATSAYNQEQHEMAKKTGGICGPACKSYKKCQKNFTRRDTQFCKKFTG